MNDDYHLYRVIDKSDWEQLHQNFLLPLTAVDQKDGYVHLSMLEDLAETARLHYDFSKGLKALEFTQLALQDGLGWHEVPSRGKKFPHYSGVIKSEMINKIYDLASLLQMAEFKEMNNENS